MPEAITEEQRELPWQEGALRLHCAQPADGGRHPALIVIHEAFGVDAHIEALTRRFAQAGYHAIAPDLFSLDPFGRTVTPDEIKETFRLRMAVPAARRMDPAATEEALGSLPPERAARLRSVMAWSAQRDMAAIVSPLFELIDWARRRDDTTDAVVMTGFCYGGGVTLRLAFAGAPLTASAPFYGQNPPLEQVTQVRCPLLLMYGRNDPFIMPGVPALLEALQQAQRPYELHLYEQAGHAFLNDTRPDAYQQEAAEDAWGQLLRFFARHLGAETAG
jgi:carboxymethylenebutenolidase